MLCGSTAIGKALRRDGAKPGDGIYVSGGLGGWRHRPDPVPRLEFGRQLVGTATACMDISDGLALDLHRLCAASNVAAALDHIPLLPGATFDEAVHDGEDYELLFTAPEGAEMGIRIGEIQKGEPGAIFFCGQRLPARGYDHFENRRSSK
jgi:thiamine-monophosphate kinase